MPNGALPNRHLVMHGRSVDYGNERASVQLMLVLQGLDDLRDWAALVVGIFRSFDCRGGRPIGSLGSEVAEYDELARQAIAASLGQWQIALRDGLIKLTEGRGAGVHR